MELKAESRFEEKKEKVTKKQPKVSSTSVFIIIILLAMVGGGFFLSRGQAKNIPLPKKVPRVTVSGPVDYGEKRIDMTEIKVVENKDYVVASLDKVKKYKIVRFSVKSEGVVVKERNFGRRALPLIAFIAPSGQLVVAISYCEPCRSTAFHTEADLTLTCHVCGTKWNLENMIALSGACMPYPPDEMRIKVKEGQIYIEKGYLKSWKPRVEV